MAEQQTQEELVTLTIDGTPISVPKGTLVIEAAKRLGVMIPHFCYHPKLTPDANCRMCLVQIEKMPKLQTSCSTRVADGMVVHASSPVVNAARKSVLEFILANHPLDCPVCDQGGRCDLQDFSHEYTPSTSRFVELKRVFPKEYFSPLIETQMNRCVQCLRCVRYCDQVMDVKALAPAGRGTLTEIKHFTTHELDCEFCGGCVQICPVGAITSRLSMYEFRPWMLKRADTVCTYCGDGCNLTIQTKHNELIEVNSTYGAGRNNGDLCARGYFGYHVSTHPDRIRTPLVRRDGRHEEATWEEALEYTADRLLKLKLAHGPEAFAGLIGARCTNEELYLFQKFMRLALGTNQLDSSVRYGYVNGIRAMSRVQGTYRWTVTFEDIVGAETLLLIGTNVTETNPITGLKVKEAVKQHGATLVTVEALEQAIGTISNITNLASHHLSVGPSQFGNVVLGLIKAVIEQGDVDPVIEQEAPAYVQAVRKRVGALSWEEVEAAAGASRTAIQEAAKTVFRASRAVILVGQGVLRGEEGEETVTNLLDVLLLTGRHSRSGCGVAPLAEENNEQGAIEMGAVAEYLPGAKPVNDPAARERLARVWADEVPSSSARTLTEILDGARSGDVKAMLVVGENPVGSLPPSMGAREALARLDFLVCQELFVTETAQMADVILPACSYAEKDGTFTNTEGHVQTVRQAIEPIGDSRPDWEILCALSVLMGYPIEYERSREILKEIRGVIDEYGPLGPVPVAPRPDRATVQSYLQEGYATDLDTRYQLKKAPQAGAATPVTLLMTQSLFHSGKFSTRAKGLLRVFPSGSLFVNPVDAERLNLEADSQVRLRNEHGEVAAPIKIVGRVPQGMVFFPEHFDEDVRRLLEARIHPETKVPSFKTARVTIEKV